MGVPRSIVTDANEYSKPLSPLTVQALAGMRDLGLQGRLSCEGVLKSARSIEAAFAATVPSVSTPHHAGTFFRGGEYAESLAGARKAAVERSRNLLDFVDRFADQLLLESNENGRWFVDGLRISHESPNEGDGDQEPHGLSVRLRSEGEDPDDGRHSNDEKEAEEGGKRAEQGRLERERQKERAAAAAVRPPPANTFVEQLCSIAWLPVLATLTNPLLPWEVGVHSVCLAGPG